MEWAGVAGCRGRRQGDVGGLGRVRGGQTAGAYNPIRPDSTRWIRKSMTTIGTWEGKALNDGALQRRLARQSRGIPHKDGDDARQAGRASSRIFGKSCKPRWNLSPCVRSKGRKERKKNIFLLLPRSGAADRERQRGSALLSPSVDKAGREPGCLGRIFPNRDGDNGCGRREISA